VDWSGEREGKSRLLRWKIYSENDPRLALPDETAWHESAETGTGEIPDDATLQKLRERLVWRYPSSAATKERAKTNVTELRRRCSEEDDEAEPARFIRRKAFDLSAQVEGVLSAAEVGTAHHRFLQRVSLEKVGSESDLESEVERLRKADLLSEAEASVLDLAALAEFWRSERGRAIRAHASAVRRELPFTARFSPADLTGANLSPPGNLPGGEFIVVQGVADLAVILRAEIWLLDFKTDTLKEQELETKVEFYRPQIQLYASAFERIYRRPVAARWLHFLCLRRTVRL
jgi:ATP-dependent helicase/nuclease subunit A